MIRHTAFAFGITALSLAIMPSMTFAQTSPDPATGGTVEAVPQKEAPVAPGAPSVSHAEGEANSIASRIEAARKQGKDVTKAEAEEKKGEAALQAGYKAEASEHFQRAKEELGTL